MQADDGYLYPLEKAFFYIHKPPTLLVYDEVESIEFMRQGAGVLSNSAKTFDLAVRMKHDQVKAAHSALKCLLAACTLAATFLQHTLAKPHCLVKENLDLVAIC